MLKTFIVLNERTHKVAREERFIGQQRNRAKGERMASSCIWREPIKLTCDAFDYPVGVVLGQRIDKKPHVIYYASHTLNDA